MKKRDAFLSKLHKRNIRLLRMVWSMKEMIKISLRCDVLPEQKREQEILQLML